MRLIKTILLLIFALPLTLFATEKDTTFKIIGKPIARIYANFHNPIAGKGKSGFEVKRAYLGYNAKLSSNFNAKVVLDIGSPNDQSEYSRLKRYAYFKNAYVGYKKDKLSINFGIISLKQFGFQEKFWGHRYIYKNICDKHGMGSSADLGTSLTYNFLSWLKADITFMNGEGYSSLQSDNTYKGGLGFTVIPYKNFFIRLYGDYTEKNSSQTTIMTFIGYEKAKSFALGLEYNIRQNNNYQSNHNRTAFSGYGWWNFYKKLQFFGRYDIVHSNTPDGFINPWDLQNDGSAIIGGIAFSPIKNIKIALNYQDWYPWAENQSNKSFIYLNLEAKL